MEEKIRELLRKMTLEEKIGQLRQCGPSLVGAFDVDFDELVNMVYDGRLPEKKFQELMEGSSMDYHEEDLRAGRIGSYNGIADAKTVNFLQKIAVEETRLGIPLLFGYDIVHGYRTVTPIPLGESCAWNPQLWEETAILAAKEGSAGGIHMTFAPMIDVAKDARWGRVSEGAGEDSLINAEYGAAKVRGFQGKDLKAPDALAACVKHFAAYGAVESGRDYNRVDMSMQRLYEEYFPPYEKAIKEGARAVMPAFNDLSGIPCSVNDWLLRKVLRDDWKFNGMTISDANAIDECVAHGIAADRKDATKKAIFAGLDMDMTSDCYSENLADLVRDGSVPEELLDKAVADVLRIKMELGLFDYPYRTDEKRESDMILRPEFRETARKAAEESMVLLKNDGVLPFSECSKIAIIGELAASRSEMTGTWAIKANGEDCVSITDAFKEHGMDYRYFAEQEILECEDITELLCKTEIILVAVGEQKNQSGEAASRSDLSLSEAHQEMLYRLKETGKPVVAVLFNGRPLTIPWMQENIPAILEAWHPGIEAGNAIWNILFGKVNPSGKLTTTFPQHSGQCPFYYDHINTGRPSGKSKFTSKYLDVPSEPVYPFGYGLSYTSYEYVDMKTQIQKDAIIISVTVKNTGLVDGIEIVQCYFHHPVARRVRPVKKLVGFARVALKAGESKMTEFRIAKKMLGYYDVDMNFVVEDGVYEFYVGGNSVECLKQEIKI